VNTLPSLVSATENWVPHATLLMPVPHSTSTFWGTERTERTQRAFILVPATCRASQTSSYLRGRLGRGVAESQFSVVSVTESPNHHPVSRDHQRVVEPACHLRSRAQGPLTHLWGARLQYLKPPQRGAWQDTCRTLVLLPGPCGTTQYSTPLGLWCSYLAHVVRHSIVHL